MLPRPRLDIRRKCSLRSARDCVRTLLVRVLGIDPALRTTGYGVIERSRARLRLVEAGIIAPRAQDPLERRLRELHCGHHRGDRTDAPGNRSSSKSSTRRYRNPLTAILMAHARGVFCLAAAQAGVAVHTLGHAHVKRALVGSGSARKAQVNAMVTHMLGLRVAPKPDDVSDALALALAFLNMSERPQQLREASVLSCFLGSAERWSSARRRRDRRHRRTGLRDRPAAVHRRKNPDRSRQPGDAGNLCRRESRRQQRPFHVLWIHQRDRARVFRSADHRRFDRSALGGAGVFAADVGDRAGDRSRAITTRSKRCPASASKRRATSSPNCKERSRSSC